MFFQVMGGQGSDMFEYFKILILQGLVAARKHSDKITTLVDVMRAGKSFFIISISWIIFQIPSLFFRLAVALFHQQLSYRSKHERAVPLEHD